MCSMYKSPYTQNSDASTKKKWTKQFNSSSLNKIIL